MKIAVAYAEGLVFQHFGHTPAFKIYEVADHTVIAASVVETTGSGHGALAGFLKEREVDVLICGGIGGGAQLALAEVGIGLYGGVNGDADDAVAALLMGELVYNPCVRCEHHGGEGHSCGHHSCASHGTV